MNDHRLLLNFENYTLRVIDSGRGDKYIQWINAMPGYSIPKESRKIIIDNMYGLILGSRKIYDINVYVDLGVITYSYVKIAGKTFSANERAVHGFKLDSTSFVDEMTELSITAGRI